MPKRRDDLDVKPGRKGRDKGAGSIYQRKTVGRWCASVTLPDGKRRVLYADNYANAKSEIKKAQAKVTNNQPIPSSSETVGAFLARWLRDVAAQRVRWTTLERYRFDVERRLIPGLGKLRFSKLDAKAVQAFIGELTASGLGARSVAHCRAVLRTALGQAEREGLIGQNPAKLATVPRHEAKRVEALTPDDARALLDAFEGHELGALVTVALATGCRIGELLGLGWEGVDLDAGTLMVRYQLQRIGVAYTLTEPKTRQSRRTLVLPPIAVDALRRHRAVQAERKLLLGAGWVNSGRVFCTPTGAYQNGASVTHRFQSQLAKASLSRMAFHDLRHGAASLLLAQGADMRRIMEQLGHSQISLTANTYTHLVPALMRDNADRLQQALARPNRSAV